MNRPTEVTAKTTAEQVFPSDSEMAALMRATDWSQTPLGPIETWSLSLRMMVRFLLANRFPLLLWWGSDFCQLYNDPYRPMLGTKHPRSMGQPASVCWSEIWNVIGPLIETPFNGGPATWSEDLFLEVKRHGFVEETHFTVAYSPVPDETAPNGIGGVLATVYETSEQMVAERRVELLRDLGARAAEAKTAEAACQIVAETLAHYPKDIPFALLYLTDPEGKQAHLATAAGLVMGTQASPLVIALGTEASDEQVWPLAEAVRTEAMQVVEDLKGRLDIVPPGPWSDPPNCAVVMPIRSNIAHQLAGLLVAGVSSRLRLDNGYTGFFELVSSQIATTIANTRAYEAERKRAEALAEIDRAKTTFFSNVSHEFRTPLTLMLGPLADLLDAPDGNDEAGALSQAAREELLVVRRNGQRLLKLVNTLLDFSRIEAGRVQASYVPTDLAGFTTDLASSFRSLCEQAGLRLVTDCPPLAEPVYVDRDMWEKIVLNLLSNAFKFTFEGSITVELHHLPSPHIASVGALPATSPVGALPAAPGAVELVVRDTGIGIPASEVPHLFERFHRVERARGRTYEGSGIGLALVRELVHLHGGSITVASAPGAGTSFCVTVPLGTGHLPADRIGTRLSLASTAVGAETFLEEAERWLPDGAFAGEPERAATPTSAPEGIRALATDTRGACIVLADDNADMREYLARLLGEQYRVEEAANGARALDAILRELPDLVLADVMMPEVDGFALLECIRSNPHTASLPVILLSARAGEEATLEGLRAGADDYLVKPFSAREVLSRVAARLEMARLRNEAHEHAERLRAILDLLPVGVAFVDAQGKAVIVNQQVKAIWGENLLLAESHADYGMYKAWWPETGRRVAAQEWGIAHALTTGESSPGVELDIETFDGTRKTILSSDAPLRDETGAIAGAMSVIVDITERKRLERRTQEALDALLQMAQTLVALPDDAPDSSREIWPDTVVAMNTRAPGEDSPAHAGSGAGGEQHVAYRLAMLARGVLGCERVGITAIEPETERLRAAAVVGLTPEQEHQWWAEQHEMEAKGVRIGEGADPGELARFRAGEIFVLDMTRPPLSELPNPYEITTMLIAPMRAGDRLVGMLSLDYGGPPHAFTDEERALAGAVAQLGAVALEREHLLRERAEAQATALALREANRRMDEFLSVASHELRTPLTSVMANVQMGERNAAALRKAGIPESLTTRLEQQHLLLQRTDRQLRRLNRLVGDLVDVSRISAGKLELRPERCDLLAIVREVVEAQRAAWPGRRISTSMPKRDALWLVADPDRISQVVVNYLSNALKYSAANQPVDVSVRLQGERVRVAVRDHGPGLDAEQQTLLFERFSRVPGVEQQSGSGVGLGLGLYICQSIVERHSGAVGVESAFGEGSTFWFTLPLQALEAE